MTRMTGPDCVVMCNLINTHTHTQTTIIDSSKKYFGEIKNILVLFLKKRGLLYISRAGDIKKVVIR